MTLSQRNTFFKTGILTALAVLAALSAAAFVIIPAYPPAIEAATRRAGGILQGLGRLFPLAAHAPLATAVASVVYALVSLILIYYFFEKTSAPEIFYVAIFVLAFAFEGIRVMVPLKRALNLPNIYLMMSFRVLIFARYAGLFSLFTASVCAAGLHLQKQRNIILVISIVALTVALGVPLDTLAWDSSLTLITGYTSMFLLMEAGLAVITVGSFLISAYSRGSKNYIPVGIGSLLVFLGRNILLSSDTWFTPLPGILLLAAGTWCICTRLHRIYLWL